MSKMFTTIHGVQNDPRIFLSVNTLTGLDQIVVEKERRLPKSIAVLIYKNLRTNRW